jgi:hypothetical protein
MSCLPRQGDLFGHPDPLIGLRVQFDRADTPCHGDIAEIAPGSGPHIYGLTCPICGKHRGWLPKGAAAFLNETIRVFGVPHEPLKLTTKGDHHGN